MEIRVWIRIRQSDLQNIYIKVKILNIWLFKKSVQNACLMSMNKMKIFFFKAILILAIQACPKWTLRFLSVIVKSFALNGYAIWVCLKKLESRYVSSSRLMRLLCFLFQENKTPTCKVKSSSPWCSVMLHGLSENKEKNN